MKNPISVTLTVYFECPFWVGVFERISGQKLQACRVVFGSSEPKDYEVYALVMARYQTMKFGKPVEADSRRISHINPKRMQRQVSKALQSAGTSTKAQEAMRLSREAQKQERKKVNKLHKDQTADEKYLNHQIKKKEKKKGH